MKFNFRAYIFFQVDTLLTHSVCN